MITTPRIYSILRAANQRLFCSRAPRRGQASCRTDRCAILIDGDVIGPASWPFVIDALDKKAEIVKMRVYGQPQLGNNEKWKRARASLGIDFVPVPRKTGGGKNPNDIAIGMDAAILAGRDQINSVALVVKDADFSYIPKRLHELGKKSMLVLAEGAYISVARKFEAAGAEVVWYSQSETESRKPKLKAVLKTDGTGEINSIVGNENLEYVDSGPIADVMLEFAYLDSLDDHLVPAIAKFFHVNNIGPLTVWPEQCARHEALAILAQHPHREWRMNPHHLMFLSPRAQCTGSKADLEKYGSRACGMIAKGGAPILATDPSMFVDVALQKLGFLDDTVNSDLSEAIDLFCANTLNHKVLREMGLSIPPFLDTDSKKALLRAALVSTKVSGAWQVSPFDGNVRRYLLKRNMIAHEHISNRELLPVLQSYVSQHRLGCRTTYNGLVSLVDAAMKGADPSRRRD